MGGFIRATCMSDGEKALLDEGVGRELTRAREGLKVGERCGGVPPVPVEAHVSVAVRQACGALKFEDKLVLLIRL